MESLSLQVPAAGAGVGRKQRRGSRGNGDPGWLPCNPPTVQGWEAAMEHMVRLSREGVHGFPWKIGSAHTNLSSISYIYKCYYNLRQKCPFCVKLLIPRGGVSKNPADFVHVRVEDRATIHANHEIHLQYSASWEHCGHEACPRPNQGAHPLWMAACADNPACMHYGRAQICAWLQNRGLLPEAEDSTRIVHACKKWCETQYLCHGTVVHTVCPVYIAILFTFMLQGSCICLFCPCVLSASSFWLC